MATQIRTYNVGRCAIQSGTVLRPSCSHWPAGKLHPPATITLLRHCDAANKNTKAVCKHY